MTVQKLTYSESKKRSSFYVMSNQVHDLVRHLKTKKIFSRSVPSISGVNKVFALAKPEDVVRALKDLDSDDAANKTRAP